MRVFLAAAMLCLASPANALTCAVVGDSIAVGTGAYLPGCSRNAKVGISSAAVIARVPSGFDVVVISAGSNDPNNPRLAANLAAMRARATGRVIWEQPQHPRAAALVRAQAAQRGDPVVTFTPGRDGVHPANYLTVARAVAARM